MKSCRVRSVALVSSVLLSGLAGCSWAKDRQLRGIQASARADLELVRTAEEAYRAQYGNYTTDFGSLPFKRKDLKSILYKFGFTSAMAAGPGIKSPAAADFSRTDLDRLKASRPDVELGYSPTTGLEKIDFTRAAALCSDCTVTDGGHLFKAIAVALLGDARGLDAWTIDEKGDVRHVRDGLAP